MTKKVINETELIKRKSKLTKEIQHNQREIWEIEKKLHEDYYEEDGSTYKFEGSGKIHMDCTIRANSQEEAQNMAKELLERGVEWAILWTEEDIKNGTFISEFEKFDEDDVSPIYDINAYGESLIDFKFISKDAEDHTDNR